MKYLILFILLMPLASAVAVTPTMVTDSFLVINNLDEQVEYIITSGSYEEKFSLEKSEKKEISVTNEFAEEIYIYELLEVDGLGVVNSIKVLVNKEESRRLNLDDVIIARNSFPWFWVVFGVLAVFGCIIYRKQIMTLIGKF